MLTFYLNNEKRTEFYPDISGNVKDARISRNYELQTHIIRKTSVKANNKKHKKKNFYYINIYLFLIRIGFYSYGNFHRQKYFREKKKQFIFERRF